MRYRKLGQSELEVPVIIYGAWAIGGWMWGGSDEEAAVKSIQKAIDVGITCIDTAAVYGFGLSEKLVARAIKGRRDEVLVATKCGLVWDEVAPGAGYPKPTRCLRPESIRRECEISLQRLEIDTIDLYQCHWSDPDTPIDDSMAELLKLREEGKIREIGVSNFTPELIRDGLKTAPIVSNQPPYNLLRRDIENDVLPYCREASVGLIVYSPIMKGLLTGKVTMDRTFQGDDHRINSPWFQSENRRRVLDALEIIKPIAANHDCTLAQLVIAWIIGEPGITSAIVGARTDIQVEENAAAADIDLTAEERGLIRKTFEDLGDPIRTAKK